MLEKIICIDNVGVFKSGVQKVSPLKKLTLVYADNARGKSTLSSVMLACANADVKELQDRKTIGATTDQKIVMRFSPPGTAAFNAEFSATGWSGGKPNLHVFNQTFIERNIYAQGVVLPEQRESLLNLALGQAAVAERTKYDQLGIVQKECSAKVTATEAALAGYRGELTVDQFIRLEPLKDVDDQLEAVDKEINEARASSRIVGRSSFRKIPVPSFDLSGLEEVLVSSFNSLAIKAEREAKAHFAKHNGAETERWVADGLRHKHDQDCPFCGQKTGEVDLLKSYKEYFDGAYTTHLGLVANLQLEVNRQVGSRQIIQWVGALETNQSVAELWGESLDLEPLPTFDLEMANATLDAAMANLSGLVQAKVSTPHIAFDASVLKATKAALSELVEEGKRTTKRLKRLTIRSRRTRKSWPHQTSLRSKRSARDF